MSGADYTSKIKDICDSLASIDVNVEEGEMVQICLGGLASMFGAFRTVVCTRENTPSFLNVQSMLLIDENHGGTSIARCCTRREIGPVVVADKTSRFAMEAADGINEEGIEVMQIAIPDPPETGGVEARRTGKGNPPWNVGTVARKATRRASVEGSTPIQRKPDPDSVKLIREISSDRTTLKDPEKS